MNKQEKKWLKSKISTLEVISDANKGTSTQTWLNNLIKEINNKCNF